MAHRTPLGAGLKVPDTFNCDRTVLGSKVAKTFNAIRVGSQQRAASAIEGA
jgi:hypothetical protein